MRGKVKQSIVWAAVIVVLTLWAVKPSPMAAQKRAALVPPAGTWLLNFELHGDPQKINITLPGESQPRTYWFLLYTVSNETGKEVNFYPQIDLFTDTLKPYRAGVNVRRAVFEAIKKRYATTIPLLEPQQEVTGRLLMGEDNARDLVAIFEDFDAQARSVKIFVGGLSNEIVRIKSPVRFDPETMAPVESLVRRTLALEYKVPGDEFNPNSRYMLYQERSWVLR